MELDTRKNESKSDLKQQSIAIEVRPPSIPVLVLIAPRRSRKS